MKQDDRAGIQVLSVAQSNTSEISPESIEPLSQPSHPLQLLPQCDDAATAADSARSASRKTAETVETNIPKSNNEFLATIFTDLPAGLLPLVARVRGNPTQARGWGGEPWTADCTVTYSGEDNLYFTLAVYRPADDGQYRRRKAQAALLYGLMLDDIGTKAAPLEGLAACPPTWVIETSAGNYQAGYLFDEPVSDLREVETLQQSFVEAGLCDPGAGGPAARWSRLPFASNGKHSPAFPCRLLEWHPENRYPVSEIVRRFALPVVEAQREGDSPSSEPRTEIEEIYVPKAAENAVIEALRSRGLYKAALGGGKHDVTCPWVNEHTNAIDGGTAYFEANDRYPVGGFKCLHSHGRHLHIGNLLDNFGITRQAARHRPVIRVSPGELHRIVDAAERELAATGRFYQHGGLIASVVTDPGSGEPKIRPASQSSLLRALSACATWERYDGRADAFKVTDPPRSHVGVLFDMDTYSHLPSLTGIARQPYLRPDGSLMAESGFDEHSGMFGVFDERLFEVPESPSREEAAAALQELMGLLGEFPFRSEHDRSAAVSAMLTGAIRPALPTAPMFHVRAPQIASGKSYLTSLIAMFATASTPAAQSFPSSEEECGKLLLSCLMTAPAVVTFDNLTTDLVPFKTLCSALTESSISGRILGLSKTATVQTKALFLSSGNNVGPIKDMTRRCVTIALDPQCEIPAARRFKADPLGQVTHDRGKWITLALTIVKGWIHAGRPHRDGSSLASYREWSSLVRQPLLWLDLPDPATSIFEALSKDPDREMLGRLLHTWRKLFADRPTPVREVVERVEQMRLGAVAPELEDLREILREVAEERGVINRRRLGRWLARNQSRTVDGLRLSRASGTTSVERWTVELVKAV